MCLNLKELNLSINWLNKTGMNFISNWKLTEIKVLNLSNNKFLDEQKGRHKNSIESGRIGSEVASTPNIFRFDRKPPYRIQSRSRPATHG